MNAERKVNLFTKAIQVDETGDKSEIEFFVEGTYIEKNNGVYITYKETEVSGMEGTTTMLKILEDSLSIIRFGTCNSKLEFISGVQTHTNYQTPYGNMPITINTRQLEVDLRPGEKSNIHLQYSLEGGAEALMNEIVISFE
ncbi:MAG: hypothetical protein K0Q99_2235 [Clostridia bacterium]|jgi:uncharacterized beta-barrel protein YwiB (DUF1934 family)|nr:hypothetical protein [Clostridia bacterium]